MASNNSTAQFEKLESHDKEKEGHLEFKETEIENSINETEGNQIPNSTDRTPALSGTRAGKKTKLATMLSLVAIKHLVGNRFTTKTDRSQRDTLYSWNSDESSERLLHSQSSSSSDLESQTSRTGEKDSAHTGKGSRIDARIISDATIGLSDGLTVPFALTAGLSVGFSTKTVIYAGFAELISGAISMGLGGYMGARSEA